MKKLPENVINETNDLLQEVLAEAAGSIDLKTEICAPMLIEKGMAETTASRTLNARTKRGELSWRWAIYRGQRVKAYRRKA